MGNIIIKGERKSTKNIKNQNIVKILYKNKQKLKLKYEKFKK